jgi:hypothetical protein
MERKIFWEMMSLVWKIFTEVSEEQSISILHCRRISSEGKHTTSENIYYIL